MIDDIKQILSTDIEDVISSSMSLLLLRCYSVLYLDGGEPRSCSNSQREYYNQIKNNGLVMAEKKDKKVEETNIANFGLKYIPGIFKEGKLIAGHLHISGKILTDKDAIEYLKIGALKVKDFKKLPDGYKA